MNELKGHPDLAKKNFWRLMISTLYIPGTPLIGWELSKVPLGLKTVGIFVITYLSILCIHNLIVR